MTAVQDAVAHTLDSFHRAAADADFDAYFAHFAPNGVFLGTDASERWDLEAFKVFAKPYFDDGHGWTYKATERHVYIDDSGNTAWFDERLDNKMLGECRGSGVLVWRDDAWKIAQYNLTVPVPNDLVLDIVKKIRESQR